MIPYDAHIHMVLDGDDWKAALARHAQAPDEAFVRSTLAEYASRGCAYLRDGGDKHGAGAFAASIAGEYGIEYATPAFPLHIRGNYGSFIGCAFDDLEGCEALVDRSIETGATFIKVMFTGILDFNEFGALTGYALDGELMEAIISYAHGKGLAVMAHTNGAQAVKDAAEAGVDSIEHGYYTDAAAREALAASGTIWVPTLAPICNLIGTGRFPDEVLERIKTSHIEALRDATARGVTIGCGSDAGAACVHHGQGAIDEHALLREALGDSTDKLLTKGLETLRERFPGVKRNTR
ncbi:MAG: amidohydrolase family protein [bacterium]|nr:amidohydrolase family protein [bacterium]